MNRYTVEALQKAVTASDVPVLEGLLLDEDTVVAMTAANVLATMGDAGVDALRAGRERARKQGLYQHESIIREELPD